MTDRRITFTNGEINLLVSALNGLRAEVSREIAEHGEEEALKYHADPGTIAALIWKV